MCPEGEVPDATQSYCVPIPPVSMRWVYRALSLLIGYYKVRLHLVGIRRGRWFQPVSRCSACQRPYLLSASFWSSRIRLWLVWILIDLRLGRIYRVFFCRSWRLVVNFVTVWSVVYRCATSLHFSSFHSLLFQRVLLLGWVMCWLVGGCSASVALVRNCGFFTETFKFQSKKYFRQSLQNLVSFDF